MMTWTCTFQYYSPLKFGQWQYRNRKVWNSNLNLHNKHFDCNNVHADNPFSLENKSSVLLLLLLPEISLIQAHSRLVSSLLF